MIDPAQSLGFSIQANPGVYALLLGSGLSRSAGIRTGWEIVLDLLGKLAATTDQEPGADLELWYVENYHEAPDYSKLLDALAKTPSERQQLLRPYFEPNDQEREEGLKQPTMAHRAIAWLVSRGYVKVIVTTNFDQLMEKALQDEGVTPTVLSTLDQIQGALPLVHIDCCIFKVHGDYTDPRIRNTESELAEYPSEYNDLLDKILDEYGLVVCGWSAEWDQALREAMFRAVSRRFTTYWATRGELTDQAQRLTNHRGAQIIQIHDADSFFRDVQQNVESIEEYSKPHPSSTDAAVASLKRYLPRPEYIIQLSDLITDTVENVITATTGTDFGLNDPAPDKSSVTARLRRYEAACETLIAMAAVGGYWDDGSNTEVWERASQRLSTNSRVQSPSHGVWRSLMLYPGLLLMYAAGMGALERGNLDFIGRIFRREVTGYDSGSRSTSSVLTALLAIRSTSALMRKDMLEGYEPNYVPINDWLHDALREPLRSLIPDDDRYSYVFDKFELLASLGFGSAQYHDSIFASWFPWGSFIWRQGNLQRILAEIESSLQNDSQSPFIMSGIFGNNASDCSDIIKRFKTELVQSTRGMGLLRSL